MLGRADLLSVVFYSIIKLHKCAYNEIMLKMKMRNAIMQSKLTETDAETEKEDKSYPPGGVCPACGAGAQPGAFDWMRLGRQHDRGGKEE